MSSGYLLPNLPARTGRNPGLLRLPDLEFCSAFRSPSQFYMHGACHNRIGAKPFRINKRTKTRGNNRTTGGIINHVNSQQLKPLRGNNSPLPKYRQQFLLIRLHLVNGTLHAGRMGMTKKAKKKLLKGAKWLNRGIK